MRMNYLKEHKKGLYTELMVKGTLTEHLQETEKLAQKRLEQIVTKLAEQNQVNEKMKQENQMHGLD